jgi:hypothetical protein
MLAHDNQTMPAGNRARSDHGIGMTNSVEKVGIPGRAQAWQVEIMNDRKAVVRRARGVCYHR